MALLILVAALMIGILIFSYHSYRIAFYSPKERKEDIFHVPDGEQYAKYGQKMVEISLIMKEAECEWVHITAADGAKLFGRLYHYYPDAPIFLAFHGYRSSPLRDDAGAFALAQKLGFNILAVDQRSHGKSEGTAISFGIRERYDCLDWIRYVNDRFGNKTPIVLCGISMGAATVLMSSAFRYPKNVQGILADCPYASPAAIITKVATDMGYPKRLSHPIIALGARLFGHFDIHESSAVQAVQHATVPILLIHGEDDRFVPCSMSQEIYANCDCAMLHTFPDAGHGLCYITDPRRYERICVEFLWQFPALRPTLQQSDFARAILES